MPTGGGPETIGVMTACRCSARWKRLAGAFVVVLLVCLAVSVRDAYALTPGPPVILTAPTSGLGAEVGSGFFGVSVAMSPDGQTALVGAPEDDGDAGAVWVYTLIGGIWTEMQKLAAPTSGPGAEIGAGHFGRSVALLPPVGLGSAQIVLIGAPADNGDVGAVWVYTLSGGTWTETQKLTAPTIAPFAEVGAGQFGESIAVAPALSGAGSGLETALIGGPVDNSGTGAAWVCTGEPFFACTQKLIAPTSGTRKELGHGLFGYSLSLNDPGSTAIVGAPLDAGGVGAAWVFQLTSALPSYGETQKLTAPTSPPGMELGNGQFGYSVAESIGFGGDAMIGAPYDDAGVGAAWFFRNSNGVFGEQQKVTAPTAGPDEEVGPGAFGWSMGFGYSAALGSAVLIGGPQDTGGVGAAWVFTEGDTWNEVRKLTAAMPSSDQFGFDLAPSTFGTVLAGGPSTGGGAGAAWVTPFDPALHACVPKSSITFSGLILIASQYRTCSPIDIHQTRSPYLGVGGLAAGGVDYCDPTAAMDWIVWLANAGYASGVPASTDWIDPANFNAMSGYLGQMGSLMGTIPTSGTSSDGVAAGLENWLSPYVGGRLGLNVDGLPVIVESYYPVKNFGANPNLMGADAASGDLVMVNVGYYHQSGNTLVRMGGHEVTYVQGVTSAFSSSDTIHVMDPDDPSISSHFQLPYHEDEWVLKRGTGLFAGLWSVWRYGVHVPKTYYEDWSEIDPELVFSLRFGSISIDSPFSFLAASADSRSTRKLRAAGKDRVLDLAVAPIGFAEPFLRAGSNTVFEINRINGKTSRWTNGPAGASHLTYGGPAGTLFVAGAHALVALAANKRKIATAQLPSPVDALAYDQGHQRLVALFAGEHRIEFFSQKLRLLYPVAVPAKLLSGQGAVSLAIGPSGRLFVHRDGQQTVIIATSIGRGLSFRTVQLQRVADPLGLAVDDRGHLFVSSHGHLVELLGNGRRAPNSYFDGMASGPIVRVSRSFSNLPRGMRFQ